CQDGRRPVVSTSMTAYPGRLLLMILTLFVHHVDARRRQRVRAHARTVTGLCLYNVDHKRERVVLPVTHGRNEAEVPRKRGAGRRSRGVESSGPAPSTRRRFSL